MGGSATLTPGLLADDLIAIVDDARRDVLQGLGFRQYTASLVRISPVGRRIGPGSTTVTEVVIDPAPKVEAFKFDPRHFQGEPCGLDEAGLLKVTQVSLTYTESELTGQDVPDGDEFYWKLTDAHGQGITERYFVLDRPPMTDRECCPGWTVHLRSAGKPV